MRLAQIPCCLSRSRTRSFAGAGALAILLGAPEIASGDDTGSTGDLSGPNPIVLELDVPLVSDWKGSLFAHDLTGDGAPDFVITNVGHVAAYSVRGALLWHVRDEINLGDAAEDRDYPGAHAPGAAAGDIDGDGRAEVAYLLTDGTVVIRDGETGQIERHLPFPGAQAIAIANLRGRGDRDAVLQYGQRELRAVNLETGATLWHVTDWWGIEHSMVRTMDLDGDGRDEVLGPVLLDHTGRTIASAEAFDAKMDRFDSLAVGDFLTDPGLEIALAEQGGQERTIVLGVNGAGWARRHEPAGLWAIGECRRHKDPDKLAVGEFLPQRPGHEVFARSSCGNHPWVMGADGRVIATWSVRRRAPRGWCHAGDCRADPEAGLADRLRAWYQVDLRGGRSAIRGEYGIDIVRPVHWDGSGRQLLFVTERHIDGQIALVDAMTGRFLRVWPTKAARTYAADVIGDAREELIVLEARPGGSLMKVFWNDAPAAAPPGPRLWDDPAYRRLRQNWNYYSP